MDNAISASEGGEGSAYFTLSEPYEKERFIQLSTSILNTALLLYAPCGVPRRVHGLTSGAEYISEHAQLFQHCVDVISRKIYALSDIKDSRIAATLNEYVDKQKDVEVTKVARGGATEALESVFEAPAVVELPFEADVQVAATALQLVLGVWESFRTELASVQQIDTDVLEAFQLNIPRMLPAYPDISRLITNELAAELHKTIGSMSLTHEQFVALLDAYATSPEIEAVLKQHNFADLQDAKNQTLLARHPVTAFRDLMIEFIAAHRVDGNDEGKEEPEVSAARAALEAVEDAVSSQHLAVNALRMGDVGSAANCFMEAIPDQSVVIPAMLRSNLHSNLAVCNQEMENLDECIHECTLALRLNPNAYEAYRVRGKAKMMLAEWNDAANDVMRGFLLSGAFDPTEAHMVEDISREAVRATARELYQDRTDVVKTFPQRWMIDSYFSSYKDIARALDIPPIQGNDNATHLRLPQHLCSDDDQDSLALARRMASVLYDIVNKQYDSAWATLQTLRATYVPTEGAEYDDATEQALLASPIAQPILARLLNLLGSFHYLAGETSQALWAFRVSLTADSEFVDSVVKLAAVFGDLDDMNEALTYLEQAEMLERTRPDIYLHRAQILLMANEVQGAISELQRSRNLDDTNPMVWATLGLALYKADPSTPQMAKHVLQEASEKFPENMEIWLYYGEIIAQTGDVTGAMATFRTAAALDEHCPLPYVNAARAYVAMNQHDVAMKHLQKALEIDPTVSSSHIDLGQALLQAGKTEEAMAEFEVAITKARYVPEFRDALSCRMVAQVQLQVEQELGIKRGAR